MRLKIFISFVFSLFISLIQIVFVNNLPGGLHYINLPILAIIFILSIFGLKLAIWWTFGSALIFNIFYFYPFGFYFVVFSVSLLVIKIFLENYFTDKSLYSFLALMFVGIIVYEIIIFIMILIQYILGQNFFINVNFEFLIKKLKMFFYNSIFTIIIFYIFNFITLRLKPVFLIKSSFK